MLTKCEFFIEDKSEISPKVFRMENETTDLTKIQMWGLKVLYDLEKWKNSVFSYSTMSPNYSRRDNIILQLQNNLVFEMSKDFS